MIITQYNEFVFRSVYCIQYLDFENYYMIGLVTTSVLNDCALRVGSTFIHSMKW